MRAFGYLCIHTDGSIDRIAQATRCHRVIGSSGHRSMVATTCDDCIVLCLALYAVLMWPVRILCVAV